MNWKFCYLESIDSTNIYAQSHLSTFNEDEITVIYTYNQTKGKGQIGKSWFSDVGSNLCFSLLFFPNDLYAADSFKLLMRVSLAIQQTLKTQVGVETTIKWPNDIYYGDQKLAGILIQNGIKRKKMKYVLVGIGLNVNTLSFPSDLPNPISLSSITGKIYNLDTLITDLAIHIGEAMMAPPKDLLSQYTGHLHRLQIWSSFRSKTGEDFQGKILGVDQSGCLIIEDKSGKLLKYNFHEIQFV